MAPDVHRLLEREAQRINSTILMNRRAYADLTSNLLSGKSTKAMQSETGVDNFKTAVSGEKRNSTGNRETGEIMTQFWDIAEKNERSLTFLRE